MSKKLFDFVIGNPPYNQEFSKDGNATFASPVYNDFMDAACEVADKVELIHPARFLFNAGSTPKAWNEKMLHDPHFKVLHYEEDATRIFSNTEIKGGVAITYHDNDTFFGEIGIFTPYEELNSILHRVLLVSPTDNIAQLGLSAYAYHFTEKMHVDFPDIKTTTIIVGDKEKPLLSKGHEYDLKSNVLSKLPMVFFSECPSDGQVYATIIGRENNERVTRFIKREYLNTVPNLEKFKVFVPCASGVGEFGEVLGQTIVASPFVGHTETFFSIGSFDREQDAENLSKYLTTKFARTLLSVLKRTQHLTPEVWKYVPLQDFTAASDIDWAKSIHDIDLQLYRKYSLSKEEIDFIEANVKEMV